MASEVVIVGAGYAGLEGIAEPQDYVADVIDRYPRCRMAGARFVLVEAQERVMREIPAPVVHRLGLPLTEQGPIEVDATMRVTGRGNVWAIGDAAAVPDPAKRRRAASPPTCRHAIRQGRRVAENVAATMRGRSPRAFRYRTLGVFFGRASAELGQLGHRAALRELGGGS